MLHGSFTAPAIPPDGSRCPARESVPVRAYLIGAASIQKRQLMKFMQQAAVVLFILGQERLIQVETVVVIEQDLEHRCLAQFHWYAAHQLADFRDDPVLLLQEFLIFPGEVVVQLVFDKHPPAVEVILPVIIKTEAVFKIPAALTGPR